MTGGVTTGAKPSIEALSFENSKSGKTLNERIEQKAYDIYLKRGRIDGYDVHDWLEAEKQVLSEISSKDFLGQWLKSLCGWDSDERTR